MAAARRDPATDAQLEAHAEAAAQQLLAGRPGNQLPSTAEFVDVNARLAARLDAAGLEVPPGKRMRTRQLVGEALKAAIVERGQGVRGLGRG